MKTKENRIVYFNDGQGGKVGTRWSVTGTHPGKFASVPATGKSVNITTINIHRVSNGQIQEVWLNWDTPDMLAIPAQSEAGA